MKAFRIAFGVLHPKRGNEGPSHDLHEWHTFWHPRPQKEGTRRDGGDKAHRKHGAAGQSIGVQLPFGTLPRGIGPKLQKSLVGPKSHEGDEGRHQHHGIRISPIGSL